jgi:hypothetical protein
MSTRTPARSGPTAVATPVHAAQTPKIRARSAGSAYAPRSTASAAGRINAAPAPWTNLDPINARSDGASADATAPSMNVRRPARITRTRPNRSAIVPAGSSSAARITSGALPIHCSRKTETPRSLPIAGRAIVAAVPSSVIKADARIRPESCRARISAARLHPRSRD